MLRPSSHKTARTASGVEAVSITVDAVKTEPGDLFAEIRKLVELQSQLPLVLTFEMAAQQLSISVPTLKRMVRDGEILSVPVFRRMGIPRAEVERIARGEPSPVGLHKSSVSRRQRKMEAKSEAASIRALTKKI